MHSVKKSTSDDNRINWIILFTKLYILRTTNIQFSFKHIGIKAVFFLVIFIYCIWWICHNFQLFDQKVQKLYVRWVNSKYPPVFLIRIFACVEFVLFFTALYRYTAVWNFWVLQKFSYQINKNLFIKFMCIFDKIYIRITLKKLNILYDELCWGIECQLLSFMKHIHSTVKLHFHELPSMRCSWWFFRSEKYC